MLPDQKLDALVARYKAIEHELASQVRPDSYVRLSREFAELGPIVATVNAYRSVAAEIAGIEALIADPATDTQLRSMAAADSIGCGGKSGIVCGWPAAGRTARGGVASVG